LPTRVHSSQSNFGQCLLLKEACSDSHHLFPSLWHLEHREGQQHCQVLSRYSVKEIIYLWVNFKKQTHTNLKSIEDYICFAFIIDFNIREQSPGIPGDP
jgi:hypothetical protein